MKGLELVKTEKVNLYLMSGDTLEVTYTRNYISERTGKLIDSVDEVITTYNITEKQHITVIKIYKIKDFDGIKGGYVIALGEE